MTHNDPSHDNELNDLETASPTADLFDGISGFEIGLVVAGLVLTLAVAAFFVVVILRNAKSDGRS